MQGLGRYYEIDVTCQGDVDPITGYFINISEIDRAVHQYALPVIQNTLARYDSDALVPMGDLLNHLITATQPSLNNTISELTLKLTPFYDLTIRSTDLQHVYLRQQFEFAAAHRLHIETLSDERNREIFGKCNHSSGHGHNYRVVVTVRAPIGQDGNVIPVQQIDETIDINAIRLLDHKHLNTDVSQFSDLNPSVENIAKVIYNFIEQPIEQLGVCLVDVSVWETSKTVCTYSGDATPPSLQSNPQTTTAIPSE